MTPGELVGSIAAGTALIIPAIKWLISDWANKSTELEKLKKQNTASAISRLEEEGKTFRLAIGTLTKDMRELSATVLQGSADTKILKAILEDTRKNFDIHHQNFATNIRNIIKTEVIELSKQARLIRDKKNGAS